MASNIPDEVDTVIIGNGPSALILSYILHGHIPYYTGIHHDSILHSKLQHKQNLLSLTPDLYDHFLSSLRYSTQSLPINTFFDTLLRPNADTDIHSETHIDWKYEPDRYIPHVVLGNADRPGGQWADNTVESSWQIGTLSYAEQLSLPGYSFADHYLVENGHPLPDFVRPSREEVARYYATYPAAVSISNSVYSSIEAKQIIRIGDGFLVQSPPIRCKHLILASGIFSINIPPPPSLSPLARNPQLEETDKPLLVIGSGFSAADVIISHPNRKILHIFKWDPDDRPSPLRGCHHQAYPEYAEVYRQMKLAAIKSSNKKPVSRARMKRKGSSVFISRDWESQYEGFPNAEILELSTTDAENRCMLKIRLNCGDVVDRPVGCLEYVVGRRGTLDYLSEQLRREVLDSADVPDNSPPGLISGRTLRLKAEVNLEMAPNIFIIGSLTGDSLVRHAFGGCVYAAGRILDADRGAHTQYDGSNKEVKQPATTPRIPLSLKRPGTPEVRPNGVAHQDLHLDRRKFRKEAEQMEVQNDVWKQTGWWGGGFVS
ncbi:hypothetical protein M501DRAFT_1006055 [Patellaria atrata CBS 101060]|uniref:L-ornithine N(5)-monooxygenase n=1 Tax=Patellaria atrata CBS 101060 TaxID=1346257 RepID=A0A9P4VS13_9PEZI|nr:hypothetical protein M501DRAFT_1006055 [Patellaria atrata CBS 101060]